MSFGARLLLAIVAILAVTVVTLTVATNRWLRKDLEQGFITDLEGEARLVALAIPRDKAALPQTARDIGRQLGRRVTLIDSAGLVLGDSDFDDASLRLLENHTDRPEVRDAFQGRTGVFRRPSVSTGRIELKVAIPAWPGVVRISAPPEQVEAVVSDTRRVILLAALIALLFGTVLAAIGGQALSRPLRALADATRTLASGSTPRYPATSVPEVRRLVTAFRSMQEELDARISALERGREKMDTLIESMVEAVLATDAGGAIVVCNGAARKLVNYRPDDVLPNIRELFVNIDARNLVDQVMRGQMVLGREIALDERTVLATARPLPTGGAVVCMHDVTDIKRLQSIRRDFVANVSHELKTPLTSISGYAETLLGEKPDAETERKFLEIILANAQRMQRLVDDLLDLARLESGGWTPRRETVDPLEAGKIAWAAFADRAAERNVTFEATGAEDQLLSADPEALRQILSNLFDNALRHTPAGGRISLEVSRADGMVQIAVRDTGSGIPAEHVPRVFERFYRADPARSRDQGGTGLGLSIVKHMVDAHGGRVDLESAVGRGTTVRVTLPAAAVPA